MDERDNTAHESTKRDDQRMMESTLSRRPVPDAEETGPEVDEEKILAFIYKQLPPEETQLVNRRITLFRTWQSSYSDLLASEFIRTGGYPE